KFTTKLAILVADIPPGSWTRYTVTTPANIEDSLGPGCYKPATRCYKPLQLAAFLKPATNKVGRQSDRMLQAATTCNQGQRRSNVLRPRPVGRWGWQRAAPKVSLSPRRRDLSRTGPYRRAKPMFIRVL